METAPLVLVALATAGLALFGAWRSLRPYLPNWVWSVYFLAAAGVLLAYAILWTVTL